MYDPVYNPLFRFQLSAREYLGLLSLNHQGLSDHDHAQARVELYKQAAAARQHAWPENFAASLDNDWLTVYA